MNIDSQTAKILGLDKDEALILQKLHTKPFKIAEISKETNIARTSLYYMLPRLESRGFIRQVKQGKKLLWEKDRNIKDTYEKALGSLVNAEEQNISLNTFSNETKVSVLKKEKMLQIFEDIANLPSRTRIYGIQPDTSFLQAIEYISFEDLLRINTIIKQKSIIVEGIIHERSIDSMENLFSKNDLKRFLESFGGRSADTVTLPPNYLEKTISEVYLYNNTVALINWKNEFAIKIQNKDIYDLLKAMFDSTKYMLNKYDQNEKIARKLVELG